MECQRTFLQVHSKEAFSIESIYMIILANGTQSRDFFMVFTNSLKFYVPIHLIPVIIFKLRKLRKEPKRVIYGFLKNVGRSCMFLATYMSILKYCICLFKNLSGQNRPLVVILSGLCTFPGMYWEAPGRRTEMGLYFLSPFLEGMWMWFEKRGYVTSIKYGEIYLFVFAMAIIMYCYQQEPDAIKDTYLSLCKKKTVGRELTHTNILLC